MIGEAESHTFNLPKVTRGVSSRAMIASFSTPLDLLASFHSSQCPLSLRTVPCVRLSFSRSVLFYCVTTLTSQPRCNGWTVMDTQALMSQSVSFLLEFIIGAIKQVCLSGGVEIHATLEMMGQRKSP